MENKFAASHFFKYLLVIILNYLLVYFTVYTIELSINVEKLVDIRFP